jgi:hypothetical protein
MRTHVDPNANPMWAPCEPVNKQMTNKGRWVKGQSGNPAGRPVQRRTARTDG